MGSRELGKDRLQASGTQRCKCKECSKGYTILTSTQRVYMEEIRKQAIKDHNTQETVDAA